jgi:hypothetical protein
LKKHLKQRRLYRKQEELKKERVSQKLENFDERASAQSSQYHFVPGLLNREADLSDV